MQKTYDHFETKSSISWQNNVNIKKLFTQVQNKSRQEWLQSMEEGNNFDC